MIGLVEIKMARSKPKRKETERRPLRYMNEMRAVRLVSLPDGDETRQVLQCNAGVTGAGVFYANGEMETIDGPWRVTIEGPKKDTVNLMFRAALKSVGFKILLEK